MKKRYRLSRAAEVVLGISLDVAFVGGILAAIWLDARYGLVDEWWFPLAWLVGVVAGILAVGVGAFLIGPGRKESIADGLGWAR